MEIDFYRFPEILKKLLHETHKNSLLFNVIKCECYSQ